MRRGVVWAMLAAVVAAGVFSALGEPLLGAVYALALVGVGAFHYAYACRRCGNDACAINPRSPEFLLRLRPAPVREDERAQRPREQYSDLDAKTAGLPLVAVIVLGLYGTYLFNPLAAAALFAVLGLGAAGYSRVTCTGCGNRCPANRNSAYKKWSRSRRG